MNATDQILIDKLKRAIADLNQRLAELGSTRDAIIVDMLSLAEIVAQLENTVSKLEDKDNSSPTFQYWSFL